MWTDWKNTLKLQPDQITLSTCLELVRKEVVQIFFEVFCAHAIDVEALMKVIDDIYFTSVQKGFRNGQQKKHRNKQQYLNTMMNQVPKFPSSLCIPNFHVAA